MTERVPTGIKGMDGIIGGGFIKNSVNLLSGGTGTGKTIFSLQFIFNGAKHFNERGIYVSFEECEEDLREDVASLGFNFDEVGEKIKFIYIPPYSISDFITLLRENIAEFRPQRVVIDSLSALAMPMEDNFERKKEIFRIRETLKESNCTTILTSEIPGAGPMVEAGGKFSRFGVEEFLCDAVMVLHYAGLGGETDRAVRVVKMRKTNHRRGPIAIIIGENGVEVTDAKYEY
jgi:circadian clock protein KaiC